MEPIITPGINVGTIIAVFGAVVGIIVVAGAGILYATAFGDPQKTQLAKNAFIGAFVGMIISGMSFFAPRIVGVLVLDPVGGVSLETDIGLNCDGILQEQLVFQRGASTPGRMNEVIRRIQANHNECDSEVWSPEVNVNVGYVHCFHQTPNANHNGEVTPTPMPTPTRAPVGDAVVPEGLTIGGQLDFPRTTSGRDSDNNIIIYWGAKLGDRPADSASCWLYDARLRTWHASFFVP